MLPNLTSGFSVTRCTATPRTLREKTVWKRRGASSSPYWMRHPPSRPTPLVRGARRALTRCLLGTQVGATLGCTPILHAEIAIVRDLEPEETRMNESSDGTRIRLIVLGALSGACGTLAMDLLLYSAIDMLGVMRSSRSGSLRDR